jgi:hypothetical protein
VGSINVFPCDPAPLPFTGTYTIVIDPSSGATGNVTLTFSEFPPPLTYGISPGGPTKVVTIPAPGQFALVTFRAYAGERISLWLANATVGGFLRAYGPDGSTIRDIWISTNNNDSNTRFIDTLTLSPPGTYTLMVRLNGTGTRSVNLTLYDVPADISNPITAGGPPVTATLTVPGQNALFPFTATAGQRISFNFSSTTAYGWWEVGNPDGSEQQLNLSSGGGFVEPLTVSTTGNYTLQFDGDYLVGTLTATMYNVPADFSGQITVNGSAANINTSPGQNANLTFTGTANQLVTVRVTNNNMGSVRVTLLDANNNTLTSTTTSATNFNLTQKTLTANGTYRINVNPSGANAGNISVSVTSP